MTEHDLPCPQPDEVNYDLAQTLSTIVFLRTQIPEDALTVGALGTERSGHGVLINHSGLILTIGYLIAEAENIWILSGDGGAIPGFAVGYDQASGLGLVQALQRLDLPIMQLGSSKRLRIQEQVVVAGHGGRQNAIKARISAKQEFAGYWEYLLDEAIFTTPAHPNWGGTALIGSDGRLCGIGSLLVQTGRGDTSTDSNLFVPIDLLPPILDDLQTIGRANRPPRPWLGMMISEIKSNLVVINLIDDGPAEQAGIQTGDVVLAVADQEVEELAPFYRLVWNTGSAGTDIPLTVLRQGEQLEIIIHSANRYEFLKKPGLH